MPRPIRKAAVLGAGIMGSGIAAQLANAGVNVLLLDVLPSELTPADLAQGATREDPRWRNRIVRAGFDAMRQAKPAALYSSRRTSLIETGNFEDDWHHLADCDWIVEAVVERLEVKREVMAKLDLVRSEGTIVSSNTSGLSLAAMSEGRSPAFREHFLVTHFFNPVRYMRLLELVPGADTRPEVAEAMASFGRLRLGKGIVWGKDTPNFVGNRIGIYGIAATLAAMTEMGLSIEEVDAVTGPAMGRPGSATFGTADLVGLDVMLHTFRTSREGCPDDEGHDLYTPPAFATGLVEAGTLGRKSGAGFYRMDKGEGGDKVKLAFDWRTGEYRPEAKVDFASVKATRKVFDPAARLRLLAGGDDRGAAFAWRVLRDTLAYTSRRLGEIADSLGEIERAMRGGYNWELGPFEIWDALGVAATVARMRGEGVEPAPWVDAMLAAGQASFYQTGGAGLAAWDPGSARLVPVETPPTFLVLREQGAAGARVWGDQTAALHDLGDGIACLRFESQSQPALNPLDDAMIAGLAAGLERAERDFRGLVVHHQGENFCAGANLLGVLTAAKAGQWAAIEAGVRALQSVTTSLRRSRLPVVTAPFGYALGGGAELTLAGDHVVAYAETYLGLVEVGVGLVPAGGGTLLLLERMLDPNVKPFNDNLPQVQRAFEAIAMAKVSTSADEARELGFLGPSDFVELNRDQQLWSAKRLAIALAEIGYQPPLPRTFALPGRAGQATLEMGLHNMEITHWISAHDRLVARHVARILCGGDTTIHCPVGPETILDLEREAFLSLCGEPATHARIEHMLKTGKPLRN